MLECALDGLGEGSGDEHVSDLARRVMALQSMDGAEEIVGEKADGEARTRPEEVVAAIAPEDAIATELEKVRSGQSLQDDIEQI